MEFHFFALSALGSGISGGDRIFIELAKRWSKKHLVNIYVWSEGREMCRRSELESGRIKYHVSDMEPWYHFGFLANYIARILEGIYLGLTLKLSDPKEAIIYSASDFWMDTFPAFILKLRYPNAKWIASWFQTAPKPWSGYAGGRYRLSALFYFMSQLPVKPLINTRANYVFVNNESERAVFEKLNVRERVFVFIGAIDLTRILEWQKKHKRTSVVYDGVFQGRFHPQKGVLELIDIWKKVVEKKPKAKLAMIGDGPLMSEVKSQIAKYKLRENVELFGFVLDGDKKFEIFSKSRVVLHPAFYDSGGMASAEAMAFGLPCVGFDLPAYKSYYPKGMITVKLGNIKAFSESVIDLLTKKKLYDKTSKDALSMIKVNWSWDERASESLKFIRG